VPSTVTLVEGSMAASAFSAACCGVNDSALGAGAPCAGLAGSTTCWAVFLPLVHSQTSRPLRIRSVSARLPTRATRALSVPSYQTRAVCDPVTSDIGVIEVPLTSGSAGKPSRAVSTTVPDSGVPSAFDTSTSSCAADRCGRAGDAPAVIGRVTAAATTTSAAPGTAHTSRRREVEFSVLMGPSLPGRACDDAERD
jgi:hypothetical protein